MGKTGRFYKLFIQVISRRGKIVKINNQAIVSPFIANWNILVFLVYIFSTAQKCNTRFVISCILWRKRKMSSVIQLFLFYKNVQIFTKIVKTTAFWKHSWQYFLRKCFTLTTNNRYGFLSRSFYQSPTYYGLSSKRSVATDGGARKCF